MKTEDLPVKLTIAKPAWGVLLWVRGDCNVVSAYASHTRATREAAELNDVPGQSAQAVPIEWWVKRR
jgi:hypothetical protein